MATDLTPALSQLAQVLERTGAVPILREGRVVPSVVYDLRYRLIVTSCAFRLNSKIRPVRPTARWIRADQLKFVQFIAIRPWLVSTIREWSESRGDSQRSMLTSDRLRRGFLGDTLHDRLVEFLVAAGVLSRATNGTHLIEGHRADFMEFLAVEATEHGLFVAERNALTTLRGITLTNDMLEGL